MLVWLGLLYYGPQWYPLRAPFILEPSFLDQAIPFLPQTAWIYQSLFLLLPLAAWFQTNERFVRFAWGFCLLVLIFSAIFWLFPSELRSTRTQATECWAYTHLVADVDGPRNAFPSLHAALTVYSGLSLLRFLRTSPAVCSSIILWVLALLISTLTTKQHIFSDLVVGGLGGYLAFALCFHRQLTPALIRFM